MEKNIIEGKYIGMVTIDFHISTGEPRLLPPDELNEAINNGMSGMLEELIREEIGSVADVTVTKQESWITDLRDKGGNTDGVHETGQ